MPIANLLQPMVFVIHCPVNKLQGNRHLVFMTGGKHKGVIMAARDFINIGLSNVKNILWRYSNMDKYRKELML